MILALIFADTTLPDLKNADDVVAVGKDPGKLQVFLYRLNSSVCMFRMCFAPSKCEMLLLCSNRHRSIGEAW